MFHLYTRPLARSRQWFIYSAIVGPSIDMQRLVFIGFVTVVGGRPLMVLLLQIVIDACPTFDLRFVTINSYSLVQMPPPRE